VDHQLQAGSADRAAVVAEWATKAGFDPVLVVPVQVDGRPGGPEAAAREARYEALTAAAARTGAGQLLLGHTREDQAETVLLALLRGGGLHGLAGMPLRRDEGSLAVLRPLLEISRAQTRRACVAQELAPWEDPHNSDPRFARARARTLLAALTAGLGPAVVANLARTARLAAADAQLLDSLAAHALVQARQPDGALRVSALDEVASAVRTRVLHQWAQSLGCPRGALAQVHVDALDALVVAWRGQGPAYLPGGFAVRRAGDLLRAARARPWAAEG
jgi:tRNA(Ile)-lysidine synthase